MAHFGFRIYGLYRMVYLGLRGFVFKVDLRSLRKNT